MIDKIDFVITWVDENDSKWRKDFEYYSAKETRYINTDACRYRDWGTLKYWFRGVEKYAPWVNKIFFVTYGHLPKWLNTDNPKLVIVKHEDFIPHEYLPTFNSNVIEFFFHKIKGLSEKFVYFNDDMFLIDSVLPERFFKNGLPCDIGELTLRKPDRLVFSVTVFTSIGIINAHFDKKDSLRKEFHKWHNLRYIKPSIRNLLYYRLRFFPGFITHHLPQGYLKQTYDDVWSKCEEDLIRTCRNKFRSYSDVAHWLIRYWQLASGQFSPYNVFKDGKFYSIKENNIYEIKNCLDNKKKKIICLNDNSCTLRFEDYRKIILEGFERILPNKCSYEL